MTNPNILDICLSQEDYLKCLQNEYCYRRTVIENALNSVFSEVYPNTRICFLLCGSFVLKNMAFSSDIDYFMILEHPIDEQLAKKYHSTFCDFTKETWARHNILDDVFVNRKYFSENALHLQVFRNETIRNSFLTGEIYSSDKHFKDELEGKQHLWKNVLTSHNTLGSLLEKTYKKIEEYDTRFLDKSIFYPKGFIKKIGLLNIGLRLTRDEFFIAEAKVKKVCETIHTLTRLKDYLYYSHSEKHIAITEDCVDYYGGKLGILNLKNMIREVNDYIHNLLDAILNNNTGKPGAKRRAHEK